MLMGDHDCRGTVRSVVAMITRMAGTGTEFINSLTAFKAAAQGGYSPTAPIPLPFERDFATGLRESAKLSLPDWEAVRGIPHQAYGAGARGRQGLPPRMDASSTRR